MKISFIIIMTINLLAATQVALAKTKYSSSIQSTVTNGKNNGTDERYIGLWLSGKANIGLTRHSMLSLNLKAGGQRYQESEKDKTDIDIQANYIYQPSSGYFSPTYNLKLQGVQEDFSSGKNDKLSVSVSRYKPISNLMEYGLTFRVSKQTGITDVDTNSLIFNLDYFYNPKTILYTTFIISDEETETSVSAVANQNNLSAKSNDIAGGHAPGEPGYHGPALSVGNHLSESDNNSIFLGAVYSIDAHQTIDIAFIKHFYDVKEQGSSHSYYFALDYFYKF